MALTPKQQIEYQLFKFEQDAIIRDQTEEARQKANRAYNNGLWKSVCWRNPLAYFVLKR